jgi:hypothetical protein
LEISISGQAVGISFIKPPSPPSFHRRQLNLEIRPSIIPKIFSFAKVVFFALSVLIFKATGACHEHQTLDVRRSFERDLHGLSLVTFKELKCYKF